MKKKYLWVDLSIVNLLIVAVLGFILRSKMIFELRRINYLNLLDAHSHFAFDGWISLALILLLVQELLSPEFKKRPIYQWCLGMIALSAYGMLVTMPFDNNGLFANLFSATFILATYIFGGLFLKDIGKTELNKTSFLFSVSAIISLILSSAGPILLAWLHATNSMNALLYRDASYFYLHLQYNGFFTCAVFALLFNKLFLRISKKDQQRYYWFSILLCISIFPSLFLSFLWQAPNGLFHIIALSGSFLIFMSIGWFIFSALPVLKYSLVSSLLVRNILLLSIAAFVLKMILQGFTIFPLIGNAVFGDRPVIIGYLHLIFLGFVSPFILGYYLQKKYLNIKVRLTAYAITVFMIAVVLNETILFLQGFGAMFLKGSMVYLWLLWIISMLLVAATILLLTARIRSRSYSDE